MAECKISFLGTSLFKRKSLTPVATIDEGRSPAAPQCEQQGGGEGVSLAPFTDFKEAPIFTFMSHSGPFPSPRASGSLLVSVPSLPSAHFFVSHNSAFD